MSGDGGSVVSVELSAQTDKKDQTEADADPPMGQTNATNTATEQQKNKVQGKEEQSDQVTKEEEGEEAAEGAGVVETEAEADDGDDELEDQIKFLLNRGRATGDKSFRNRMIFRSLLLWFITVLCCVALWAGFRQVQTQAYSNVVAYSLDASLPILLDIDSCDVTFRQGSAESKFGAVFSTHGMMTTMKSQNTIVVNDTRLPGAKYANFACKAVFTVPKNTRLANTTLNFNGFIPSRLTVTDMLWSRLTIAVLHPNTMWLQGTLKDTTFDHLAMAFNIGDVTLLDCYFNKNVHLTIGSEAEVSLRTTHPVELRVGPTAPGLCLTGRTVTPNGTSYLIETGFGAINGSLPIITATGPGKLSLMAFAASPAFPFQAPDLLDNYMRDHAQTLDIGYGAAALPARLAERIKASIAAYDVVTFTLGGPGTPQYAWISSSLDFYILMPISFLDVVSIRLLSPSQAVSQTSLSPGFCPGLQWAGHHEWNQELAINVFKTMASSLGLDRLTFVPLSQLADPTDLDVIPFAGKVLIQRVAQSGLYRIQQFDFSFSDHLVAMTIVAAILGLFSSVYLVSLIRFRLKHYFEERFDRWGLAYFKQQADGDYLEQWAEAKTALRVQTGYFFWVEFVGGVPRTEKKLSANARTVLEHLASLGLPLLPNVTCLWLFFNTKGAQGLGTGTSTAHVLAIVFVIFLVFQTLVGVIYLQFYYLRLMANPFAKVSRVLYKYCSYANLFIALFYVSQVILWWILGVMVKPGRILPLLAVVLVVGAHLAGAWMRIMKLVGAIKSMEDLFETQINADPKKALAAAEISDLQVKDVKKLSTSNIIMAVQKTKILEISGGTIAAQILREVLVSLILVAMVCFLALGFFVLSATGDLSSYLTTGLIMLLGGGVNIPLAAGKQSDEGMKAWEATVRDQGEQDIIKAKAKQEGVVATEEPTAGEKKLQ